MSNLKRDKVFKILSVDKDSLKPITALIQKMLRAHPLNDLHSSDGEAIFQDHICPKLREYNTHKLQYLGDKDGDEDNKITLCIKQLISTEKHNLARKVVKREKSDSDISKYGASPMKKSSASNLDVIDLSFLTIDTSLVDDSGKIMKFSSCLLNEILHEKSSTSPNNDIVSRFSFSACYKATYIA